LFSFYKYNKPLKIPLVGSVKTSQIGEILPDKIKNHSRKKAQKTQKEIQIFILRFLCFFAAIF